MGIADKLRVKFSAVASQVITIHVEKWFFQRVDLKECVCVCSREREVRQYIYYKLQ